VAKRLSGSGSTDLGRYRRPGPPPLMQLLHCVNIHPSINPEGPARTKAEGARLTRRPSLRRKTAKSCQNRKKKFLRSFGMLQNLLNCGPWYLCRQRKLLFLSFSSCTSQIRQLAEIIFVCSSVDLSLLNCCLLTSSSCQEGVEGTGSKASRLSRRCNLRVKSD
jgi:hypothetical protein